MTEEWRPIPGWEGYYEASSLGRIRNLATGSGRQPGRVLKPTSTSRYEQVALCKSGKPVTQYVHRLVCAAFHGESPGAGDTDVLHWDDNPKNNQPDNLRWGSPSKNMYDRVRNGRYRNQNTDKSYCIRNHPLPADRKCRECIRLRRKELAEIGLPESDIRHGTLTAYTQWSCRCSRCKEAMREYDAAKHRSRTK